MRMRERERSEIPKAGAERGATVCGGGTPSRERDDALHPVERVYGILGKPGSTDEYLKEIRGR